MSMEERHSMEEKHSMEERHSTELAKTYDPRGLEDRLYQKWLDRKYFRAEVDYDIPPL